MWGGGGWVRMCGWVKVGGGEVGVPLRVCPMQGISVWNQPHPLCPPPYPSGNAAASSPPPLLLLAGQGSRGGAQEQWERRDHGRLHPGQRARQDVAGGWVGRWEPPPLAGGRWVHGAGRMVGRKMGVRGESERILGGAVWLHGRPPPLPLLAACRAWSSCPPWTTPRSSTWSRILRSLTR